MLCKEPFDLENTPILRHTIFNIETGFTYTSFVVLDKEITEEGNIVYYAKEDTPRRTITCEATNCDGCNFENNNGTYGGAIGETCVLALVLGFVYLLVRRIITWHIPVIYIGTVFVFSYIFDI